MQIKEKGQKASKRRQTQIKDRVGGVRSSPLTSEKPWKNCRMSAVVAVKGRPRMITKVPAGAGTVPAAPAAAPAAAAAAAAAAE